MADPTVPAPPSAAAPGAAAAAKFDPAGKTFVQRVDALIADAKATHAITITKDNGRTSEWQHKHHVAHMFAYNKYKSVKPANPKTGGNTIAWDHFSDATLDWTPLLQSEFLRTAKGGTPKKEAGAWTKDEIPDEAKTLENVQLLLKSAGIGNGGAAMVSAGYSPCKEPCKCTASRSKHLSDMASDLSNLAALTPKLTAAKAGTLDEYLKTFGLHRPLVDHPESPEEWHVEAIGDTSTE